MNPGRSLKSAAASPTQRQRVVNSPFQPRELRLLRNVSPALFVSSEGRFNEIVEPGKSLWHSMGLGATRK